MFAEDLKQRGGSLRASTISELERELRPSPAVGPCNLSNIIVTVIARVR